jgi:hypothetical protein
VVPAQRRADGPLPSPGELVVLVRDRAAATLSGSAPAETTDLSRACELVVRLALSCVTAPPAEGRVADLVRTVLPGRPAP